MGIGYFLASGRVTNPGAAFTAVTPNTGDSLQIPAYNMSSGGWIENAWAHEATPGVLRIRSPKLHDNVQGIRLTVPSANPYALLADEADQPVVQLDNLLVDMTGGAAETDVAVLQFYLNDMSGADQQLATWDQVKPRIINIATNEVDCSAPAVIGNWSPGNALNANFDQLHAQSKYAILGYETSAACAAVAVTGPDTSQLKVGGPGVLDPKETRRWFINQSLLEGRPHIPIIQQANKGATLVYTLSASAPAVINVGLIIAELSGS